MARKGFIMTTYKVIGIHEFVSQKSNKSWVQIFTTFPMDGITGIACEHFFCSPDVIQGKLELGKQILPYFRQNSNFIQALQVL